MKRIPTISNKSISFIYVNNNENIIIRKKKGFRFFVYIIVIILLTLTLNLNNKSYLSKKINHKKYVFINKSNIDYNYKFFQIDEVKKQILTKNLSLIKTLFSEHKNVGNSLLILNNLIIVCEKIRCKNIICPSGLKNIIKNPILNKEKDIKILPYSYKNYTLIDITLSTRNIIHFEYLKNIIKYSIIREEVFNNLPKYKANKSDLIINIRSGDIFLNHIHRNYSQPPLCFYQKIINENKFDNIYILSNGHENPIVDKLLNLYTKIKYIEGTIEEAISMIVNAYNIVIPISTFTKTLVWLNTNLLNLYLYEIYESFFINVNYTVHKMKPSKNYLKTMKYNWKNTIQQLDLMINEKCINSKIISFNKYNNTMFV